MSRFFINRPIFAWVLAIIAMLAGVISIMNLPVAKFPEIAPPQISINAVYPGASAETVENAVTQIIEREMKGIDGLVYVTSTSSSNGAASVQLTFESGTDPDIAQVQVQNKLQSATPRLPEEVQRQGIAVNKSSSGFLVVVGFISADNSMDRSDIADYIDSQILDPISRVDGVGDIRVFGSPYAMRIWLNPEQLVSYGLMPSDVITAVRAQNAQVSAGQIGGLPSTDQQVINATITVQSRLSTATEFENILLKTQSSGATVRLGDVARVEIGSEDYSSESRYNRQNAAGLAISLASGANALEVRDQVENRLDELSQSFPAGLEAFYPYDTTPFVKLSIKDVIKTLLEAIVLVFLVMYLFLQNWRATIIPTLSVPVTLLGTFAVLLYLGYSINTLTLFAMVLAIGLLVDDAIVVVENVERILEEEDLSPKEATIKSMQQIGKVVVGIAVVLSAVFIPMAFFGGSTGVIYRQFSITLVTSMVLSAVVALSLTPALCATLLKAKDVHKEPRFKFFSKFNNLVQRSTERYKNFVGKSMYRTSRFVILYALLGGVLAFLFIKTPTGFLPEEDQGILFTLVQLPSGATQADTMEVIHKVEDYFLEQETEAVEGVFGVGGFSFAGQGQNMGIAFVRMKDWSERPGAQNTTQAVAGRATGYFMQNVIGASVFAFSPPAVIELGNASGFNLQLQDTGNVGHEALINARNQLLGMAAQDPLLTSVRPNGQEDAPVLKVSVDQSKAAALGVSLSDINAVLSSAIGSSYVNDFTDRGKVKRVYLQGDPEARMTPEDIGRWYVRSASGEMVSMNAIATSSWSYGPPQLTRYNSFSSVNIQGEAAAGHSTGEAMQAMTKLISQLPAGIGFEWTGLSLQEQQSGAQAPLLYALSILVVFLALAALYESWSVPFAVLLVIPLGILGALGLTHLRGLSNDIYLQVGMLIIIGLSAKNAILIVEFAKENIDSGMNLFDSITLAAKQRLRPIVMTSLALGLGVVPLFIASGAGSGSQNAIGTGVLGGVLSATILGIFFIPLFFVWIYRLFGMGKEQSPPDSPLESSDPKAAS